jgi:hypothetical protein
MDEQEFEQQQEFEYKFVHLKGSFFGSLKEPEQEYQDVIHEHAKKGWRLVQIFSPGIGQYGNPKYYEIVLERSINKKPI